MHMLAQEASDLQDSKELGAFYFGDNAAMNEATSSSLLEVEELGETCYNSALLGTIPAIAILMVRDELLPAA